MVTDPAERKRSTRLKPLPSDAPADPAALPPSSHGHDLDAPALYLNRELTWLAFNRRVLHEAQDERTPLLERVKFLAIVHSNLDEFFMKRISGLKQQLGAGVQTLSVDWRTPAQQIEECYAVVRGMMVELRQLARTLFNLLEREGIRVAHFDSLSREEQAMLRDDYRRDIFRSSRRWPSIRHTFHVIREHGAVLVRHPYESFTTAVRRRGQPRPEGPGNQDDHLPDRRTIADHRSPHRGGGDDKQVAVVVELKARFDESANIHWANRLEEAGIHVVGLKTHCKVIYVLRRDHDGRRRYAHTATGNYHAGTARLYSDLEMFTCDPEIAEDLTELFNFLTSGQAIERRYRKLLPAPRVLKQALIDKIEREISRHREDTPGLIQFKMNALEDKDITRALYRASQAGVNVDLIVRDTCRLRPGLPGLSEPVTVVSIVGRFLEHARIYYFCNGGEEEYFIGSADCMTRNLESRVEVVTPVENPDLRARLRDILEVQLNDRRSAWEMQTDGTYRQRHPVDGQECRSAQEILIELAAQRQQDRRAAIQIA